MQFIFFSILALSFSAVSSLSLVARQQGAPSCALNCLATTPTGSCGTDDTCLCHDETFLEAQLACVKKDCTSSQDFAAAQQFAITLCQEVGVDLTTDTSLLPQGTSASNSAAAPTTTSPSTSPSATSSATSPSATSSATSPSATSPATSPTPSPTQTSGAISLNVRAPAALLFAVAGIALTL